MTETLPRRRAFLLMASAAALWSIAGVFTRHLDEVRGFEITFWRSLFTACFVAAALCWRHGAKVLRKVRNVGAIGALSGFFWGMMFSCFMMALTMTTVANTMVVNSIVPLLTAAMAWLFLGQPVAMRTWIAVGLASLGIAWMFAGNMAEFGYAHLAGMGVALVVPFAAASNFIIMKKAGHKVDLIPTVFLGALFSACMMLPMALPFQATAHDIGMMAILGVFQLGLPCMLLVRASLALSAPEIALIAMLEIVLAPLWTWLGAGEVPAQATVIGGIFVMAALIWNEVSMLRQLKAMEK